MTKEAEAATVKTQDTKVKMRLPPESVRKNVIPKTYLVEFAPHSVNTKHFPTVIKSLKTTHDIPPSGIRERYTIQSSLFTGVSFTVTDNHPVEAIELIPGAIAIHPVYTVQRPDPIKTSISSDALAGSGADWFRSYNLTGVTQTHEQFQNFGEGVRVRKASSDEFSLFLL